MIAVGSIDCHDGVSVIIVVLTAMLLLLIVR